jgi:hypothetical protein
MDSVCCKYCWIFTFMWRCIVTNFLMIKPTRCTNLSSFILEMKFYMFWTVPLSIIRSYSLCTQQWCISYRFVDSSRGGSWSKAVYKPVWHMPLLSVQWITPDDGQRNCPKHSEFHFQNKFEKLVHVVSFIIRKYCWVAVWKAGEVSRQGH